MPTELSFPRCAGRSLYSIVFALFLATVPAAQAATVSYSYDALGRLVQVNLSIGVTLTYTYNNAGNRTLELVTGAKALSPDQKAAVVTLLLQLILDD